MSRPYVDLQCLVIGEDKSALAAAELVLDFCECASVVEYRRHGKAIAVRHPGENQVDNVVTHRSVGDVSCQNMS